MTEIKFEDLGLSEATLHAVQKMGFQFASPIQAEAIPHLINGLDVIGQAQTGTGKTAAFGIPMIQAIDTNDRMVQGIVLCPTRELAVQVSEEIKKLAEFVKGLKVTAIYGGDSMDRQIRALKMGVHIVVGTPGRVIDHIDRGTLKLDAIAVAVLDEADEMLAMGFREDIELILQNAPTERQTVMFSATMSKEILQLTKKFQKDATIVKVTKKEVTNANIEQLYFDVKHGSKNEVLCRLIDFYNLKLSLVFSNQKKRVDEIVEELNARGYSAEGLHGDMRQQARNATMSRFRNGQVNFLVATDVAARGIDVENVDAVINYDVPLDPEYYVHRIGRTGRAGKQGKALLLASGSERYKLKDITNYTKVIIDKGEIPSKKTILESKQDRFVAEVVEKSTLELSDYQGYTDALLASNQSPELIIAALVKMNLGNQKINYTDENLDGEADRKSGRRDRGDSGRERERPRNDRSFERRHRVESDGPRGQRTDKTGRPYETEKMAKLSINIGRFEKISPSNIVGAIAGESGVPGKMLGQIDIYDKHTHIDVPTGMVNTILNRMMGVKIKGKRVNVELAK